MILRKLPFFVSFLLFAITAFAQSKPKLTFDEFFNAVGYVSVELSPDGNFVVIGTERADWDQQIFRHDLWLYRTGNSDDNKSGSLIPLAQSGHDTEPKWSPDGHWIAFLSERKPASEKDSDSSDDKDADKEGTAQVYVISPSGGEAIPLTQGQEEVHTFSWSADSHTIYFATRQPWSKSQKDDYKKQWKDVVQYRTAERGDTIFALDLAEALARNTAAPAKNSDDEKDSDLTPGTRGVATSPLRVENLITSPDGSKLAFVSNAINQRQEKVEDVELYEVNVAQPPSAAYAGSENKPAGPRRLTHNQAVEVRPRWANDSRHILFGVEVGDVSGPYRDLQPHLYWIDTEKPGSEKPENDAGTVEQWSKDYSGEINQYAVTSSAVLASARLGTEVPMYSVARPTQSLHKLNSWPGTYEIISAAVHSQRVAFLYSSLQKPAEIYLADSPDKLDQARPITFFNKQIADTDLPQGKPYKWKADDGTTVEGMLIYPPAKFEQKNLPMYTFIHGGPADADGNHFEADWYQYAALAATNGWLVFEPNYRGSTGYGDKFLTQIVPQIVSRPGKDILEGVDALVKDGIADPDHLTVGGYSYGGYMTNWLITQTTRWKAAVTGAGAVEHVGNWGNDDTTSDDAYFLGGRPWEAAQRYHDEAAIFQIDKVRTPTHMVAGADDIRVAVLEDYLLEHALYSLGIPNALLVFPGEGHSLDKNPWHGKIKVREELKWLQKYGGVPEGN
ncbi:MAG TPA: prolyl oligopeptidase family serine peptidase [Candidatus Aquilonibacter sp.]|nr:prolyl oligopeptidase family serine peptidase [Candidatus Aquilonibacter sp.]